MKKNEILKLLDTIIISKKLDGFIEAKKPITNSKEIQPGDIFICIEGFETDGHKYGENAINRGASLLITQRLLDLDIPQIVVSNSRIAASILCKLYYNNPTSKIELVGITGTNGKTTTADLFHQALLQLGYKAGLIGTLGYKINNSLFPTERTTPDIIELNEIFNKMISAEIEYVVMEVSSHAIALNRIFGLEFNAGIFTNLTQDHLDFHNSIEEYAETKFKLFEQIKNNNGISFVNIDDHFGGILYEKKHYKKFGISFIDGDIVINNIVANIEGSKFTITQNGKHHHFQTSLIGKYNLFNLTATISLLKEFFPEIKIEKINEIISNLEIVPGRLQKANSKEGVGVYVDYAHSPDALDNVLSTVKKICKGRVICVFGAGGDRDITKRPFMFEATKSADFRIITTDNPRTEDPSEIIRDIVAKKDKCEGYWIIQDRKKAIETAISIAHPGDIVLIAGKGHETYQEIMGEKKYFNDLEIAEAYKENLEHSLAVPIDSLMLEKIFSQKLLNYFSFEHISTDTRTIEPNSIFFALKGKNFDGHDYVEKALKQKNCIAIISDDLKTSSDRIIKVKNTTSAYGKLASIYKKIFSIKSVAITGSYGKTTTKEYLYNILSQKNPTLKTYANENNLVGLPKTIFNLSTKDYYAIFELGSNHFGEIKALTNICQANINVITSIGPSHLEFFHDEMGVFQEKTTIFRGKNETRIFPGDDLRFSELNGITFGKKAECDYRISDIYCNDLSSNFKLNNHQFSIESPFYENVSNAAIAASIAIELKVSKSDILQGLKVKLQSSNRMEIIKEDELTIISDCYNANPASMIAAIKFWNNYENSKPHIAILGDMLELGVLTDKLHKDIWNTLKDKNYVKIIAVGKYSIHYQANDHFKNIEGLIKSEIYKKFPKNSVILLKASRGIKLEKIITKLIKRGK